MSFDNIPPKPNQEPVQVFVSPEELFTQIAIVGIQDVQGQLTIKKEEKLRKAIGARFKEHFDAMRKVDASNNQTPTQNPSKDNKGFSKKYT